MKTQFGRKRLSRAIDRTSLHAALNVMLYEHDVGEKTSAAVGRRLVHVRDCAGIHQASMARYLGVTQLSLRQYEQGRMLPNARAITALRALGINSTWVLTGTGAVLVDDGIPMVLTVGDTPEDSSLTQANGWGLAGECPASFSAKTPAAGARCYRVAGVASMDGDTISLCVSLRRPGGGVG